MKLTPLLLVIVLLGAGCSDANPESSERVSETRPQPATNTPGTTNTPNMTGVPSTAKVVLPVQEYAARATVKRFGEYIDDRFRGYHVGDDIEFTDDASLKTEIPVFAIADGVVSRVHRVSGYGGLIVVDHEVDGKTVHALYGHVDLGSTKRKPGERVGRGDFLANLGDGKTPETDGERKHLHFGLYEGADRRIAGYEPTARAVDSWINPTEFFVAHGALTPEAREVDPSAERGGEALRLRFSLPAGWEIEYIPSLQAWNLFETRGSGIARARSQILIRYFDASTFQTLSTVTIHDTKDLIVGKGKYTATRYDIEKKPGVSPFADQPEWRNARHIVTDFRGGTGRTRYYVVAANPALDSETYESILASMEIIP